MEGASLFLEKYFLEELATDYNALFSDLEKHATTQVLKMNALDHFFSVAKLELLCHLMHLKQMTKLDLPQPDTQIIALLNHLSGEENTAANLYERFSKSGRFFAGTNI
jgi:hypothetical protein